MNATNNTPTFLIESNFFRTTQLYQLTGDVKTPVDIRAKEVASNIFSNTLLDGSIFLSSKGISTAGFCLIFTPQFGTLALAALLVTSILFIAAATIRIQQDFERRESESSDAINTVKEMYADIAKSKSILDLSRDSTSTVSAKIFTHSWPNFWQQEILDIQLLT